MAEITKERVIFDTLTKFGVRLPVQYERADLEEKVRLTGILAEHIARALRESEGGASER